MGADDPKRNSETDVGDGEKQKQEQEQEQPKVFTLEILKLIKDGQQQHGLRHGDYQRYRGYCSRRIRRLRKVLRMPQGDRRHFKKREVSEAHIAGQRADERFLHIPLMLTERCWAYAMQLRQESNTELRKKFHLIQKLRKACIYAGKLDELCQLERCDARTKLESQAYLAWIEGTLQFELQRWSQAAENLKKAQMIYEKLSSALPQDEQVSYKQRVEEIAPTLRYCAYNIGDEKAVDLLELRSQGVLENFDALLLQTKEKTAAVLHEIEWFDLNVPIRLEKIRLFLLSVESLDESLRHAENHQAKVKILENFLIDLRDVISLVRESARTEKQDQILLSYLLSLRIERTSQRNLLLLAQTRKPQDCIRLLDINVQQTNEMMQNESIKDSRTAKDYYEAQVRAYKAIRSYYLAKAYASQRKWREAVVLFDVALKAVSEIQSKTAKFVEELKSLLKKVKEDAELDITVAKANHVLEQQEDQTIPLLPPAKTYKSKKPLIERLDEFREEPQLLTKNPNLVNLPPAMEPVPVKPLFFDLALNHVTFPDLSERLEGGGQPKQKQPAGISGFVKGLWGWGKK